MEVEACETLCDVAGKLQCREGIPAIQQRLLFNGRNLEGDRMLSEYGIEKESTLFLMLALRGGCCWFFSIMILITICVLLCLMPCTMGTSGLCALALMPPLLILPCFCL